MGTRLHLWVVLALTMAAGPVSATEAVPGPSAAATDAQDIQGTPHAEAEAVAQIGRGLAEYLAHGLHAMATADLGALEPNERTAALNALARATVDSGPKLSEMPAAPDPGIFPEGSPERKSAEDARVAVEVATDAVRYLERAIVFRGDAATGAAEARAEIDRMNARMAGHGGALAFAPFALRPVREELAALIESRRAALDEIASSAGDPFSDTQFLATIAARPEGMTQPAERVLLGILLDRAIASQDTGVAEQAEMIRGLAALMCAEGGLRAILRLKEDQGSALTVEQVGRSAAITLGSLQAIAVTPGTKRADAD